MAISEKACPRSRSRRGSARESPLPRLRRAAVRLDDRAAGRLPGEALRTLRPRPAGAPAAERAEAEAAAAALGAAAPNRVSLQAWIGSSGWSALEPERRFLFSAESLRRLGPARGPGPTASLGACGRPC